jgi:anti-anti-sigma factor
MKFSIDKQDKYTVFKLNETKLDTSFAPSLKSEYITMHAEGIRNVIMDLEDVKYTDSSGLSALLVGNRTFQQEGGIFILTNLSDHAHKLIKISQLDGVLNILPTVAEAIDAVFMNEIENDLQDGED